MMSFIKCSHGGCLVATDLVYHVLAFICKLPRYMYLGYSEYSFFTLRHVPCVSWGYITIQTSHRGWSTAQKYGQNPLAVLFLSKSTPSL